MQVVPSRLLRAARQGRGQGRGQGRAEGRRLCGHQLLREPAFCSQGVISSSPRLSLHSVRGPGACLVPHEDPELPVVSHLFPLLCEPGILHTRWFWLGQNFREK